MSSLRPPQPILGLVIPCYNEAAVLPRLLNELEKFGARCGCTLQVLFIDDGSRDTTYQIIAAAAAENPRLACLRFSRNFGHQTAVYAGIAHSNADVVGIMDADLQDPPDVLLRMLEQWRAGYDVVYGVREKRKEGLILRTAYSAFYRLFKTISQVEMPLDAGDFCVMDRRVVDVLKRIPEQSPFLRGLRSWVGFRQIGLPYDRPQRAAGRTKYNWSRLTNLAIQGLVSFSSVPLRLAAWLGLAASALGFVLLLWAAISALVLDRIPPGWASLAVMVLFFGGIQLIMLGVLGEYVGRIFEQVKNRPLFVVESQAGWLQQPPSQ